MSNALDYQPGESFLHRMSPLLKLLIAFAICAACFITTSHLVILALIALTLALAATAGQGRWAAGVIVSLFKLSVLLFVVQALFTQTGTPLLQLPLGLALTDVGVSFSLLFVLRLIASALPLALMLRVTNGTSLANSLNRGLRVPYKYAFAISSSMRFVPAFAHEMQETIEAQTARGVALDSKNPFKKLRLLVPLCLPLLLSSVRKSQTAAIAAELRGLSLRC
jgi:energy-coupling factor transport system permease protein